MKRYDRAPARSLHFELRPVRTPGKINVGRLLALLGVF